MRTWKYNTTDVFPPEMFQCLSKLGIKEKFEDQLNDDVVFFHEVVSEHFPAFDIVRNDKHEFCHNLLL